MGLLNGRSAAFKQRLLASSFIFLFGGLGTVLLVTSYAATPTASLEPESGIVSSSATKVTDSNASNQEAVKFGSGSPSSSACPALPAYPDANCTGWRHTGVTLTKVPAQVTSGTGWTWSSSRSQILVSAPNVVLDGLDVSGSIANDNHNTNLTVKNSYVRCVPAPSDDCIKSYGGLTITDTEIGGGATGMQFIGGTRGIELGSGTITRVHIHNTADAIRADPTSSVPITITDSYIHDLALAQDNGGVSPHSDGVQTESGAPGNAVVVIQHNSIEGGDNDGVFFQSGGAFTVADNYFTAISPTRSTTDKTSFGVGGGGSAIAGPIHITNNRFAGTAISKPWQILAIQDDFWPSSGKIISGNVYMDGSSAN